MRRRIPATMFAVLFAGAPLPAQTPPELTECLEALARTASTFGATAPGLMADEVFNQRGRQGFVEIPGGRPSGRKDSIRNLDIKLPQEFHSHQLVSKYGLAEWPDTRILHETRAITTFDGTTLESDAAGETRHALTIGLLSPGDRTKRRQLEDLARDQLEGAVTDFGPLILLFTERLQGNYVFSRATEQSIGEEPAVVINYRQVSGSQGLAFFENRTGERQPAAGEIWFRRRDLLPLRITIRTQSLVSNKFTIRTEASVDYMPSPFGLVPESVTHKQFLNSDLMVENDLHYTGHHRDSAMIP
jgi:hypothetical protein